MHKHALSLAAAVALLLPAAAAAQTAVTAAPASVDSLTFRAGQWGAIIGLDRDLATVGLLRFRSPRVAWVANALIGAGYGQSHGLTSGTQSRYGQGSLGLRLGLRAHRPVRARVVSYSGAGLAGGGAWSRSASSTGERSGQWGANAGLYAELGMQFRVTPYLALGVGTEAGASVQWTRGWREAPGYPSSKGRDWYLSGSAGRLQTFGTFYF